jgi:hypothetical protein
MQKLSSSSVWFTRFSSNIVLLKRIGLCIHFQAGMSVRNFIQFGVARINKIMCLLNSEMKMDLMMGQAAKGHTQTTRHRTRIPMMIVSSKCVFSFDSFLIYQLCSVKTALKYACS